MTSLSKCTSWRGHKFVGRYSIGAATPYDFERGSIRAITEILEASKSKTYERDICVRCGMVVPK